MSCRIQHRGFALPTLMALLAMASIATLLAMRNLWVNAQLLNAQDDLLRTQHKAEAVLPVALADLLGTANTGNTTNSNGEVTSSLRHTAGSQTQTHAFFPTSSAEYDLLRQRLSTGIGTDTCNAGICAPSTLDPNSTKASYWKTQTTSAMAVNATDTPDGGNTAWYWIEVFPQANTTTFAYRITALANGVMPGSGTVLQTIWTRNTPTTSATTSAGQWQSWHLLHD